MPHGVTQPRLRLKRRSVILEILRLLHNAHVLISNGHT
jgi:hypothetical protein